jgi:hypothetical protein
MPVYADCGQTMVWAGSVMFLTDGCHQYDLRNRRFFVTIHIIVMEILEERRGSENAIA